MLGKTLMQFLSRLFSLLSVAFFVYFVVKTFMGKDDMLLFNSVDFFVAYLFAGLMFFVLLYLVGGAFDRYFGKK